MRMSKRQRDAMYERVVWRELILGLPLANVGPYCRACGIEVQKDPRGPLFQGQIDNIPNDGDHRDLRKLQLLCRPCNTAKNPRRSSEPDNRLELTPSEQKNEECERKFRNLAIRWMCDAGSDGRKFSDMVNSGAELVSNSTVASGRYLKKLCSSVGPFRCVKGVVTWRSADEVDAWFDRGDL